MRRAPVILVIIFLLAICSACSKGYEISKKTDDLSVTVRLDKNPPVAGPNNMEIRILDKSGKPVKDARVIVNYSMSAMSGMPAMDYIFVAKPDGDLYRAPVNYSMPGTWNHEIRIERDKTDTVKFTMDVR